MTKDNQQKNQSIPLFNITTRGAAVESLKRNPQFRGKEVGNILSAVEASPNDWSLPLNPVETSLVFLGVMSGAHSLKTPVMITLDREFWAGMNKQDLHAKNGSYAKEVFCPDPQAVTLFYDPNPQEALA